MKIILLAVLLSSPTFYAFAQDTKPAPLLSPWTRELQTGININQASYSSNWKSGGTSSLATGMFLNAKADYRTDKHDWTNNVQLLYGNIQNKGQIMKKNADRIFLESKYAYRMTKGWSAFGSGSFMSQFAGGYEYYKLKDSTGKEVGDEKARRISGFMSPAYTVEALGFEYKPVDYFSAQFGLFGLRQSYVLDQTLYNQYDSSNAKFNLLYGVERGQNIRNQMVFQFVANYDKEVVKNIFIKARYMLLVDYAKINHTGIVNRLDANITAKVNKYINVNIAGVLLYDYAQDKDIQYSQVLSLGILYGLSNQPKK